MALYTLHKKNGKDFLVMELSKATATRLNSLKKKRVNDLRKMIKETSNILKNELDSKLDRFSNEILSNSEGS